MSNIQYGLISKIDSQLLEKTIDLIIRGIKEKDERYVFVTEIGLYNCATAIGVRKYLMEHNIHHIAYTGIDNEKDKPIDAPEWVHYIKGNSNEVYNQLKDNSQHLIFVDGDHSYIGVISDFFAYADKVKVGGYFAFHDTGKHVKPFKDFQHGDKNNPDAYISVRHALDKIGLLKEREYDTYESEDNVAFQWQLIFDEADPADEAGGICVFKKLY